MVRTFTLCCVVSMLVSVAKGLVKGCQRNIFTDYERKFLGIDIKFIYSAVLIEPINFSLPHTTILKGMCLGLEIYYICPINCLTCKSALNFAFIF